MTINPEKPRQNIAGVVALGIGFSLLAALPLAAQEEPPEPVEVEILEEEPVPSRISLAGWCVLRSERKQPADQPAEGEGEDVGEQAGEQQEELGCDAGASFALLGRDFRQGRLSLVGVIGVRSLGIGGAWTFGRQGGYPLSVALGVVMPYSDQGVFADEAALAVGATVALFGRR